MLLAGMLLAAALQSCEEDLQGIDISRWPLSNKQLVYDMFRFTLTPCRAIDVWNNEYEPANDFKIGEDVWFVLSVRNGCSEPIFLPKGNGGWGFERIQIYDYEGNFVTTLRTTLAGGINDYESGCELGAYKKSDERYWGVYQHCWPAGFPKDKDSDVDPVYWRGKPLASKGIYRAVLKNNIPIFKPNSDGTPPREVMFMADLDLSVNFIIR